MHEMTIGQLAQAASVNVETVRYYHRRGLLPQPLRPMGGIRRYSSDALTRLRFIRRAQSLGFTLDEIEALLSLQDGQTCSDARAIGEHKLTDVRQRIRDLRTLEDALEMLVQRCSSSQGKVACPLIEALMVESEGANPVANAATG
jgi:MerR family mercuric resistance operon transcriptional regulator